MDRRWLTFNKALVGSFHTNLALGDSYGTIKPEYLMSLKDPNLKRIMTLQIYTSGLEDLLHSSKGITIQYQMIYRLVNSVNPIPMNFEAHTEVYGPGSNLVIPIAPSIVNLRQLTWPRNWVLNFTPQSSMVEL